MVLAAPRLGTQTYQVELDWSTQCQYNVTGSGIVSSVWGMILLSGSTIKVSIELPIATRHRRDKLMEPELTHFSETFPSNSNDLECIKMGTTKPRCIMFRHSLRCIDVFVIFVFKTNSTLQRF